MARVAAKTRRPGKIPKTLPGPHRLTDALAVAEARCANRGERLTPIRREVLGILLSTQGPLGAYDILERLGPHSGQAPYPRRPAPYAVYRALAFLCDNGFVHRLESRNAYLACLSPHAPGDLIIFLICEDCGTVGETASPQVASGIESAVRAAQFTPKARIIEISGICTRCREKKADRKRATNP